MRMTSLVASRRIIHPCRLKLCTSVHCRSDWAGTWCCHCSAVSHLQKMLWLLSICFRLAHIASTSSWGADFAVEVATALLPGGISYPHLTPRFLQWPSHWGLRLLWFPVPLSSHFLQQGDPPPSSSLIFLASILPSLALQDFLRNIRSFKEASLKVPSFIYYSRLIAEIIARCFLV